MKRGLISVKFQTITRLALLTLVMVSLSGCACCKKGKKGGETTPPTIEAKAPPTGDELQPAVREGEVKPIPEMTTIYFDYDKSEIRKDQKAAMDANAAWLLANPKVIVQVEGNCDERGTREYNFNLGMRRAQSVISYMKMKGVAPDRLHPISYGEDRPVALGHNEESWWQNRRDEFKQIVTAPQGK